MIQTTPLRYGPRIGSTPLKPECLVVHYGQPEIFYGFKSATCGQKSNKGLKFSLETKHITCRKCIAFLVKKALGNT